MQSYKSSFLMKAILLKKVARSSGQFHARADRMGGIHSGCFFRTASILVLVLGGVGSVLDSAVAAMLPSGFTESEIVSGVPSPTAMEFAPDGRLFVCEQGGKLRVIKNGVLLATPFLAVPVNSQGERGLLGVAFDPNFSVNKFVPPTKNLWAFQRA